jgi:dipeptidyl aminopeptidase/acylaminoacyl peptidase
MTLKPSAVGLEASKKKPKQGMALVNTRSGLISHFDEVDRFVFSEDGRWLAYLLFKEEKKVVKKEEEETEVKAEPEKKKDEKVGSTLILRRLESGEERKVSHVQSFAFDNQSHYLAFAVASPGGKENGIYLLNIMQKDPSQKEISKNEKGLFSNLEWSKQGSSLAYLSKEPGEESGSRADVSLWIWSGKEDKKIQAVSPQMVSEGWILPEKNQVSWTRDGKRIFVGLKPEKYEEEAMEKKDNEEEIDLFDQEQILKKREVDVWHWNDPFIITQQKLMWPRLKDQTYLGVFHLSTKSFVQLADEEMPTLRRPENSHYALGQSDVPYRKEATWYGRLNDLFAVDLENGERIKIISRLEDRSSLSPGGRYVVFYKDKHWHLFDIKSRSSRNLTDKLDVPFCDEDHDYPSAVPGYGVGGWIEDDQAVLIYDKYDVWKFASETGEAVNITAGHGRTNQVTFRVIDMDPDRSFYTKQESLLLSSYHNFNKNFGFYSCKVDKPGIEKILEEKKKFRFMAKAKEADVLMYTRESFEEFPDIWISDMKFRSPKKISEANPQISDFTWGEPELVEWNSIDGIPLQGVLIKPGNYVPGKRYPVIVYFYRFFSQRMYEFNQMVVNHRPNFPFYTSNGYAVFLPDIRFEVGHPGFSSTKCLVPGVQKLIDMGIADPDAIGLHGHSWSGYQTAFVITQTNIFACAIAGAPVSNMTSAYSGIRWGSGLARQFQYEKTQSRIGGSLWEYPERYIENSPVFFADRINTPTLIMFGDEDGAVPWYQGIELYLAMRRFGKDCIFLQYRGEPHHPQKYANKLDYSIKMKQYFDHYLKGEEAPGWIKKGVPYLGK